MSIHVALVSQGLAPHSLMSKNRELQCYNLFHDSFIIMSIASHLDHPAPAPCPLILTCLFLSLVNRPPYQPQHWVYYITSTRWEGVSHNVHTKSVLSCTSDVVSSGLPAQTHKPLTYYYCAFHFSCPGQEEWVVA